MGAKVFTTNNISQGWDGKFKGIDQPMGGYVWMLSLIDENNISTTKKGTVLLIR
ncbi:MAG: gliding motility-associated C-terminal domain-containing protein [Bacteroidetes bacterium]|nr:gliding motility-associated C-terminal domain-containing protein [Bacteroidota bacterium]